MSDDPLAESVIESPRLARIPWLLHGFGTRAFAERDLRRLAASRGARPVIMKQTHSDRVHVVDRLPPLPLRGDALATDRPGLWLVVKTADCLPLFLVDEERRAVAAVHAGWRGTRQAIASRAVETMAARFASDPRALLAAIGPCIGPACYEVGEDVRGSFPAEDRGPEIFRPAPGRPEKYLLDLPAANVRRLLAAGLLPGNISAAGLCTHCDGRLLSFRRDRSRHARLYSFIGLA